MLEQQPFSTQTLAVMLNFLDLAGDECHHIERISDNEYCYQDKVYSVHKDCGQHKLRLSGMLFYIDEHGPVLSEMELDSFSDDQRISMTFGELKSMAERLSIIKKVD